MEMLKFGPLVCNKSESTVGLITPQWFFSKDDLLRSPSIQGGISYEKEQHLLRQAAAFVRVLAERMNDIPNATKLTSLPISVAIIQTRRFFLINRLTEFDPRDVVTAAAFLASKSEECPRRLQDFVLCYYRLKVEIDCPKEDWDRNSRIDKKCYEQIAAYIVWIENLILQTIGFDLKVDVPHPFVLTMCKKFFPNEKAPAEIGYWLATDSLHMTDWSVRYKPETVACIVLFLMMLWKDVDIPNVEVDINGHRQRVPFFEARCELSYDDMLNILHEYTEIWKDNQANRLLAVEKFRDTEIRSRKFESPSSQSDREPGEI
ncbi:unnamed protein product [Bursaphelenchus xylophilus]|uniref:(pine wood nematode) hypothetical protein n=1 Tax=Bursaphelenchus xylophilus TaxID=6326 RepID=A0A1I7SFK7_BURXY|nr:unnamed protein product [Bursaphelenchus xylophilus]CAG9111756.1 unnamed protein product [Bursaphelenchus xylophilus]